MSLSAQQLAARKNLSYVLAGKLVQRILKGEYEPGTILSGEIEPGEQFGVSRTAVRGAVKTLTAKGMVLPRPRTDTRVMPQSNWNFPDQELLTWRMTEENFHWVIDYFLVIHICLEPQACLLITKVGTVEQKAHLDTLMAEMAALKENFRRERWIEVDMAWHEHVYETSANPFLTPFASLFRSAYHTYLTSITSDTVIKLDLHQVIVDAIIQSGDDAVFKACQVLLRLSDKRQPDNRTLNE